MPDPRYRPYRIAVISVFIGVVGLLAVLFLVSVVRTLTVVPPPPDGPDAAEAALPPYDSPLTRTTARACLRRLEGLRADLSDRFYTLGELAGRKGRQGVRTWQTFSADFETRLERVAARCHLDAPGDDPQAERLSELHYHLEELHRAYAAQVSRFLSEEGEAIQEAETAFAEARRELGVRER